MSDEEIRAYAAKLDLDMAAEGWTRIGLICSAGRRSLWLRTPETSDGRAFVTPENLPYFELRAGREGDDAYVKVTSDHPVYAELLDVLLSAKFAAETPFVCNRCFAEIKGGPSVPFRAERAVFGCPECGTLIGLEPGSPPRELIEQPVGEFAFGEEHQCVGDRDGGAK